VVVFKEIQWTKRYGCEMIRFHFSELTLLFVSQLDVADFVEDAEVDPCCWLTVIVEDCRPRRSDELHGHGIRTCLQKHVMNALPEGPIGNNGASEAVDHFKDL